MNPYRALQPRGAPAPAVDRPTSVEVTGTALFVWLMCLLRIVADALDVARPSRETAFAWIVLLLVSAILTGERRRRRTRRARPD